MVIPVCFVIFQENSYLFRTSLYLAASASAEFFADIALSPMEAVKVRIQTQPGWANNLREGVPKLWAEEGIRGYVVTNIMSLAITEAERSPENTLKDNSQIFFSRCFVFAFKTRGDMVPMYSFLYYHPVLMTDALLIWALIAFHNGQLFYYQFGLIIEWFLFNMFFYLLSFSRFYKGLPPLWMRQIPYTMMKFACFERTVEFLYKHVVPKPRSVTHCLW